MSSFIRICSSSVAQFEPFPAVALPLLDLAVLPFRAAAFEDEDAEIESHTFCAFGVSHADVLYPRGEQRFVISRPRKPKSRASMTRFALLKEVSLSASQSSGTVGCRDSYLAKLASWSLSATTGIGCSETQRRSKPFTHNTPRAAAQAC